jgi:hypothetical protein
MDGALIEQAGIEQAGIEQAGIEQAGIEQAGIERAVIEQDGSFPLKSRVGQRGSRDRSNLAGRRVEQRLAGCQNLRTEPNPGLRGVVSWPRDAAWHDNVFEVREENGACGSVSSSFPISVPT